MQSNENSGCLGKGWPTACDWLKAQVGHGPCHTFIESCPQGVLRTVRVVIQPESSGWVVTWWIVAFLRSDRIP